LPLERTYGKWIHGGSSCNTGEQLRINQATGGKVMNSDMTVLQDLNIGMPGFLFKSKGQVNKYNLEFWRRNKIDEETWINQIQLGHAKSLGSQVFLMCQGRSGIVERREQRSLKMSQTYCITQMENLMSYVWSWRKRWNVIMGNNFISSELSRQQGGPSLISPALPSYSRPPSSHYSLLCF
jgi:hypothetical protein